MTPGQARVLVLLGVLFVLEMVVHPPILAWLQGVRGTFTTNLGGK